MTPPTLHMEVCRSKSQTASEDKMIKTFAAPGEAECNLTNSSDVVQWLSGIVGDECAMFGKQNS